jgi:hypothetical protein
MVIFVNFIKFFEKNQIWKAYCPFEFAISKSTILKIVILKCAI